MARIVDSRCVLAVRDLDTSTRFYIDALGFRRDFGDGSDELSFLSRDSFKLMLGECPDEKSASELGDHSYVAYLVVDGIDQLYEDVSRRRSLMRTRHSHLMRLFALFAVATMLVVASPLSAQQPAGARLDLTMGGSSVRGGRIDFRSGFLADALAAGRLRAMSGGAIVAGLGASGILGGMGDRCLLLPNGGCAGKGNFTVVTALLGVDHAVGSGSVRVLAGPSYHNGANDASVGPQVRIDVASPAPAHLALSLMTRATFLPKHNNATLVVWGIGAGLTFR